MSNEFTADREKDATHLTCCMCYKRIEHKGNWTQGNNAEPLTVSEYGHPSIVKHDRCCDSCNDLVVQVRIMQAFGQHSTANIIIQMFKDCENQTDVILAHMRLVMAFEAMREESE